MTTDTEPTEESVLELAAKFDAGVDIDTPAKPPVADDKQAPEPKAEEKTETKVEAVADKPEAKENEAKESSETDPKEKSKWVQNKERKEKTWQEINAEKEAIKAEKEALAREKAEIQKSKAATSDVYRDKHGATKQDYLDVAKQLRAKGDPESLKHADAADKLAAEVEAEEQQFRQQKSLEERQAAWAKSYEELCAKNPALKDQNSEIHKEAVKVINEFPLLAQSPDGLKYAVRAAEINLQARDFEGTKAEFAKLKAEHEKLQKKLSIGSGPPTSAPKEAKSFSDMSLKEQEKALEQAAYEHDRAAGLL